MWLRPSNVRPHLKTGGRSWAGQKPGSRARWDSWIAVGLLRTVRKGLRENDADWKKIRTQRCKIAKGRKRRCFSTWPLSVRVASSEAERFDVPFPCFCNRSRNVGRRFASKGSDGLDRNPVQQQANRSRLQFQTSCSVLDYAMSRSASGTYLDHLTINAGADPFSATKWVRVKKRFLRRKLRQTPAA